MKSNAVAVFGGGGAKSLACAGAWRAMREAGLEIAHIVGTSMGAVIGAALASGATYDEVVIAARSLARLDGRRLADGGRRAVLGLELASKIPADLVIAIHVGPGFDEPPPSPSPAFPRLPPPLIRAHGEAIRVMMAAQVERQIADWPPQ